MRAVRSLNLPLLPPPREGEVLGVLASMGETEALEEGAGEGLPAMSTGEK